MLKPNHFTRISQMPLRKDKYLQKMIQNSEPNSSMKNMIGIRKTPSESGLSDQTIQVPTSSWTKHQEFNT